MTELVGNLNYLISLGMLLMNIATVFLVVVYFRADRVPGGGDITEFLKKWGIQLAFLVSAAATGVSLYYSEVLGFPPCSLCWFQRIFQFPLTALLALASWKRDVEISIYVILLAALGLIPALYQHVMQVANLGTLPCPAGSGVGADCAQRLVFEFGFMTMPWWAVSLFAFVIVLMFFVRRKI